MKIRLPFCRVCVRVLLFFSRTMRDDDVLTDSTASPYIEPMLRMLLAIIWYPFGSVDVAQESGSAFSPSLSECMW